MSVTRLPGSGGPCSRCGDRFPPGPSVEGLAMHGCDAPQVVATATTRALDELAAEAAQIGMTALREEPSADAAARMVTALAAYRKASSDGVDLGGEDEALWTKGADDGVVES